MCNVKKALFAIEVRIGELSYEENQVVLKVRDGQYKKKQINHKNTVLVRVAKNRVMKMQ